MKFIVQLAPIAAAMLFLVQAAPTTPHSKLSQRNCNHFSSSQSRVSCVEYCVKLGASTGECSAKDICECAKETKPTPSLEKRKHKKDLVESGEGVGNVDNANDDENDDNDYSNYMNFDDGQYEYDWTATKTANAYYNYETDIITITTRTIAVPTRAPEANTMFVMNPKPTQDSSQILFHLNKEQDDAANKRAKKDKKKKDNKRHSTDDNDNDNDNDNDDEEEEEDEAKEETMWE